MHKHSLFSLFLLLNILVQGQETTFPVNGVDDHRTKSFAFINATIQIDHETQLEKGSLLIENGLVKAVGTNVNVPANAVQIDLNGAMIYPSFIDIYANYGLPTPKEDDGGGFGDEPQMVSNKKGAYGWNQAIMPEFDADEHFKTDPKAADELRKAGFGVTLSHRHDGIARGSGLVALLADGKEREVILATDVSAHYSFDKGTSTQDYPGSLMGSIALLRQTYYDAKWYKEHQPEEFNLSLEAWNQIQNRPQFFESSDWLTALRADKVGDEFGVQYIIKGAGDEYQRIDALKQTGARFVIPLTFPEADDVEDPWDAEAVSLTDMLHWENAPKNPAALEAAGISFCLTAEGLEKPGEFIAHLKKAVDAGLSESAALAAITNRPAKWLKLDNKVGSLKKGMMANFFIASASIFDDGTKIYQHWINGQPHVIDHYDFTDFRGDYALVLRDKTSYTLKISGIAAQPDAKIEVDDSTSIDVKLDRSGPNISMHFKPSEDAEGTIRLSGMMSSDQKNWNGRGQDEKGAWLDWSAERTAPFEEEPDTSSKEAPVYEEPKVLYPFASYGNSSRPKSETFLFQNATVWTNEADGIVEGTDVLVENGKISAIGKGLKAKNAKVINAQGKHLTSGIIDEHSHIAISRGVNEWTQASSAEVSIADVVNSEDVNIYRQLAGGVTAAQLLHGSANPIGGQSGLIKFRWGSTPEEMKIKNADGFIKFALGENVKQANWGDDNTVRFPQSRMGVEQTYMNFFTKAKEYGKTWQKYNALPSKAKASTPAPRRDIELETLLQIVNSERFITCHSYVQSEINMLMKVAEHFGFRINTFTHILEGYKLADIMKKHGVNASTFSDWWAYKYEVIDAIPYNAALMTEVGVNTAINSDDAEMGRRLNQEAAKAVMYGGASEEDAWKMVTLNPAKMLHLDDRTGSIKAGKDADLVLWSDHPLSVYAKARMTLVDGICYFEQQDDLKKRDFIAAERNRLIQKIIDHKKGGGKTKKPVRKKEKYYSCGDIGEHASGIHNH